LNITRITCSIHTHTIRTIGRVNLSNLPVGSGTQSKDIANAEQYKDSIEVKLLDLCSMRPLSSLLGDPIVLFHASFCRCRRSPALQRFSTPFTLVVGTGTFDLCSWSWYEPSLLALDSWPKLFRSITKLGKSTNNATGGTPSNWSLC
jgi:hypothetical protein